MDKTKRKYNIFASFGNQAPEILPNIIFKTDVSRFSILFQETLIKKSMRQVYTFYADAFWIAVRSILKHKLRAFLTLLGVIIGVSAVVVVGASISGLNSYVTEKVSKVLGANHFMINRMASTSRLDDDEYERRNRRNKNITWEEYEYVKANCRACTEVGAQNNGGADINQDGIEMPAVRIFGVTANMSEIEDKTIAEGRF